MKHRTLLMGAMSAFLFFFIVSVFVTIQQSPPNAITGHATALSANISLSINTVLSITTGDSDLINFTGCKPNSTIYSNITHGNANEDCFGYTPSAITLRNDGNTAANVTVSSSAWGAVHNGSFLNTSSNSSWIAYSIANETSAASYEGGCIGSFEASWVNITNSSEYFACDRLSSHSQNNSISLQIGLFIPSDVNQTTTASVDLLFTASLPS